MCLLGRENSLDNGLGEESLVIPKKCMWVGGAGVT